MSSFPLLHFPDFCQGIQLSQAKPIYFLSVTFWQPSRRRDETKFAIMSPTLIIKHTSLLLRFLLFQFGVTPSLSSQNLEGIQTQSPGNLQLSLSLLLEPLVHPGNVLILTDRNGPGAKPNQINKKSKTENSRKKSHFFLYFSRIHSWWLPALLRAGHSHWFRISG